MRWKYLKTFSSTLRLRQTKIEASFYEPKELTGIDINRLHKFVAHSRPSVESGGIFDPYLEVLGITTDKRL